MSDGSIDYDYHVIKSSGLPESLLMVNVPYWERQKRIHQEIDDFSIEEDQESDGSPVNICWLKVGYISPSSGGGFFHYSSINSYEEELKRIVHISDECVSKKAALDYLWWLESNQHLLKNNKNVLTQICNLLTGKEL